LIKEQYSYYKKGSEILSKQSNQKYRKEKEKEHLKKEGLGSAIEKSGDNSDHNKINTEFKTSSGGMDR